MKPKIISLVGVVALGALAWIVVQQREITRLRSESSDLEARLAAPLGNRPAAQKGSGSSGDQGEPLSGSGIDWEEALMLAKGERGHADNAIFHRQIEALSPDQLMAAIDELEASDIPERLKMELAQRFLPRLVKVSPQIALERFGKYADSINMSTLLARAMESWTKEDSGAALAWLDGMVASNPLYANALSRISPGRIALETAVLRVMLPDKAELLVERISAMPEEEAARLFKNLRWEGSKDVEPLAIAELVRQTLPQEERDDVLRHKAGLLASGGLEKAAEFFDQIDAKPDELRACMEAVVEHRMKAPASAPDLESEMKAMRDWVAVRDVERADLLTGFGFGNALYGRDLDFDEVAPVVMIFHNSAGNDEVLHGFLKNGGCCHGARSLELAGKISDPEIREEVTRHIRSHR
ncbi:hypothetical protein OKA04_03405 [Luteolibacter flavescens]|uniref:HEAT repeat domain-containing protein n=1 Tax=Luteolibacter flavescens TaxID=1859460 RepID=A0ABT3FJP9_9BACT|nr:hypothetical protein [Luteolibacter flavescens]MCW1883760.1 hypothetical protein [Luteolibacter flavescens]